KPGRSSDDDEEEKKSDATDSDEPLAAVKEKEKKKSSTSETDSDEPLVAIKEKEKSRKRKSGKEKSKSKSKNEADDGTDQDQSIHSSDEKHSKKKMRKRGRRKKQEEEPQSAASIRLSKLKKMVVLAGFRFCYKKLFEDVADSDRARVKTLEKEMEKRGLTPPFTMESCKAFKLRKEQESELAELAKNDIIDLGEETRELIFMLYCSILYSLLFALLAFSLIRITSYKQYALYDFIPSFEKSELKKIPNTFMSNMRKSSFNS
ncbi:hypothetical protein OESDEN_06617, partial [Oesophagostomum dentatum]